jgi:hypothetical protein
VRHAEALAILLAPQHADGPRQLLP